MREYRNSLFDMKMSLGQWIDYFVLITFLLLIRLPAAFGLQFDIRARLLCLVPIIFVTWRRLIIFFTANKPLILAANRFSFLYIFYILLVTAAFVRTILNDSVETSKTLGNLFLLILALAFIFMLSSQTRRPGERLKKGIYLSWLVYIGVNLLMQALNLYARTEIFTTPPISRLASYLGLEIHRTTFPTATGINSFGNIAGILLIGSFFVLREKRLSFLMRAFGAVGILISLVTLISTDSRAASIFAILTIALSYLPSSFNRWFRLLPVASVVLPALILWTLNSLPPTLIEKISRNQTDALTLSNRTVIWSAGLETLQASPRAALFGYGYRGQVISGAVEKYKYLFSSYNEVTSLSLHNSFLQATFETGVVGAVLLVITVTILLLILERDKESTKSIWTNVLYFSLIFFTLISSTDSILTFDNQEAYITFLFIATVSFFSLSERKMNR